MKTKVLVTGGAGFIGSEVVKQLLEKGYQVRVAEVPANCEFLRVDLTNKDAAVRAMDEVDYCIHLAAKIGGIGYFHKYPATILSENNKMYSSVFEAAVAKKIKRIIYLSSSMVFESTDSFPSKEKDIGKIPPPVSSYGFSKLVGEWYCRSFFDEHGLKYTIIRPFNAYGINEAPGEEVGYAHVIPDLIKKILAGQYPLALLGDGKQTRCFTHVSDIAQGIILAMESSKAENEDFNIGSEKEMTMLQLAKLLWEKCQMKKAFKVKYVPGFKYDIRKRVPSSKKAKKVLGWIEKKKFAEELPKVIEWIKMQ
ncbi:MAG: NAD-dependent epimerase/dehydratase [Candidatus Daviesbacteria bacterium GW2011_GWF2_38_6]|uniref:NAD-dependent epimerase/dehydratase n=1 Tax=Candidatus Daviesbacteria bacterium GW2011_GWF2_38_6 TaxID=1618432 RepID=A0A0G0KB09_9BACT|nr:MAG: NAD-dependent epimerase/dehydratase [Candidatus Daviesbacteria bacterium GW2011_GWF2_38_6]